MKKASIAYFFVFALLIAFTSISIAQMSEKGWEKTAKLPSGVVILDMSGEWDVLFECYGPFSWVDPSSDILTVTQEGGKFTAVKQIGNKWVPKGAETIKGELDKDGFKAVYHYVGALNMDGTFVWEPCGWEIREDGNKVMLDCGDRAKAMLTRR
jgi:hypothetical protein